MKVIKPMITVHTYPQLNFGQKQTNIFLTSTDPEPQEKEKQQLNDYSKDHHFYVARGQK